MCSNYSVDGDEVTMVKRLLTEIYPNNSFSMVSDSYDYWNLVDNILPQCKEEIEKHNGCLLVRGDSGNPVEVVSIFDIDLGYTPIAIFGRAPGAFLVLGALVAIMNIVRKKMDEAGKPLAKPSGCLTGDCANCASKCADEKK